MCTFDRASLTPANVDILTTLHVWEMSGEDESKRVQVRNAKDDRFCKIKIDDEAATLVIVPGETDSHDSDVSNDFDYDDDTDECKESSD